MRERFLWPRPRLGPNAQQCVRASLRALLQSHSMMSRSPQGERTLVRALIAVSSIHSSLFHLGRRRSSELSNGDRGEESYVYTGRRK
jgi:hypothetical protein